jgi:predicted RNase H-like HicB family nuclease
MNTTNKNINYNCVSVIICNDNSLIGYFTDDCGITSFGKTFDDLIRNLQHAKKAIEESREKLAKEDLEEAKSKANKGVDISFNCKSSNDLKLESLNESCIDYGKTEHDPLDDLPIIGDGVLMEVSDSGLVWSERYVIGKTKSNIFLAWVNSEDIYCWKYARPITPKTKITRKEFESKFEIID